MIDGALAAARTAHFAATLLLEGGIVFGFFVLAPASEHAGKRRFFSALKWMLGLSLAVALVSGAAWLLLLAADIAESSVPSAWSDGTAWTLLGGTTFGTAWQWRTIGFVLLAALLLKLGPHANRRIRTLALALSLLLTGSLAWSGHGAATPGGRGDIHLDADHLHLIAAGVWLGGLLPFALYLKMVPGDATEATRRFSLFATAAVLVLLPTGFVNAWFTLPSAGALVSTLYGRLLLAKIALFLLMLAFAAVNRFVLLPQLASGPTAQRSVARLAIHSGCEIALGLVILAIVGLLGILDPAGHSHMAAFTDTVSGTSLLH